ncbi:MAG: RagB/SusD family nutrient uptake outer membrane protein [Williamsia sp.]|nr:RagB/SusD family nutrient uptake outer membrane protein [Williamsia sp.]
MTRLLALCTLILLTACSKLDRKPFDSLTPEDFNSSDGSLQAATNGNYARIKTMALGWHRVMEFPGDNVSLSGTTTSHLFYLYNYQRIPNNSFTTSFWTNSYQIIVSCGKIIQSVQEGKSNEADQLLGENYFLRAYLHFTLVNVFGKPYSHGRDNLGVPIKLDGDPNNTPARAKVGEVYDAVLKDLDKAESLMNTFKSNIYASREAAWALKSRVYLYMEDNQKAIDYANKVINSGRFSLLPSAQLALYPTLKPETNKETVLAVKFIPDTDDPDNGINNIGSLYSTINGAGYGEMYASQSYLELVRQFPQDQRNKFIEPNYNTNSTKIWAMYVDNTYKWVMVTVQKVGNDYQNISTGALLEKQANISGGYDYFITVGAEKKKLIIEPEMNLRNGYPKFFITKCSRQEGKPQLWSPIVSRLAEMYLNRAEAYAKLGDVGKAVADVNLIRTRAGIPSYGLYDPVSLPSGKSALDIVLEERRLELAWEGFRKFDVYRNKKDMDRRYPGTHLSGNSPISYIKSTDPFIIELIPQSQILAQANLVQNP